MNSILQQYVLLTEFLGHALGPDYEIVLHDLTDKNKSVIAIANNDISGREIGAPLTNFALKIIKEKLYLKQDYCLHYQGVSINGKNLRSCTQFIKENGKLLGMLCINFDDTRYQEFKDTVLHLCHPNHFIEKYYSAETSRRGINADSTEKFHNMAEDVAADAIDYEIAKIGVEPERLTADERIHIIATLEENGIFLLKGAVNKASIRLQCSQASIYRYISHIKKGKAI